MLFFRRFFFIVFAVASLARPLAAETNKCGEELKKHSAFYHFGVAGKHLAIGGWKTIRGLGKVYISQFSFPIELTKEMALRFPGAPKHLRAQPIEIVKNGVRALVGYLIFGLIPNTFTVSILQLHDKTDKEFMNVSDHDPVVVVDGFPQDDPGDYGYSWLEQQRHELLQHIVDDARAKGKNVILLKSRNVDELAADLNEVRRKNGPIARIDFYGHGSESGFFEQNRDLLTGSDALWSRFYHSARQDLMQPGGILRFNSCSTGLHDAELRSFGALMLPHGGKIFAATLPTVPSGLYEARMALGDVDEPTLLDRIGDYVFGAPVKLATTAALEYEDWKSKELHMYQPSLDPVKEFVIAERSPEQLKQLEVLRTEEAARKKRSGD